MKTVDSKLVTVSLYPRHVLATLCSIMALTVASPLRAASGSACPPDAADCAQPAAAENAGARTTEPVTRADTSLLYDGLDWAYCGPRPARLGPAKLQPRPGKDEPIEVSADAFAYDRLADILTLTGTVELDQGARQVRGETMTYDVNTEQVVATGGAFLAEPGVRLVGSQAQVNLDTNRGRIDDVQYRFTGNLNARGDAKEAQLVDPDVSRYRDIRYTTCPPGRNDWSIKASQLEIDQKTGDAVARDATLRVSDVPILYTPYLSFPIDGRRKTGLLVPSVGNSSDSGFELLTPYYINIAPSMDATFYPRYMSKRGLMLGAEYRVLTPHHYAELYGEGIAKDRAYEGDESRGAFRVQYRGSYGSGWSSTIDYKQVSDDQYLEDYGDNLDVTSTRNIERVGQLRYSAQGWRARLTLQDYQTVDPTIPPENRPYGRLPQLLLTVDPLELGRGIEAGLGGEYDYFDHQNKVHGNRTAVQPYLTWPIRRPYGHLIPRFNLFAATYGLEDQAPDLPDTPSYAIPSFNLDGRLIFERSADWFGQTTRQTLEPRLFYLYTPYVDQSENPIFDSTELTFSYSSLFRSNRFTGLDRIGDANQLTLGLTSRVFDTDDGDELLRASIGQILYFANRQVQIVGPPEDQSTSPIAGELAARLSTNVSGRASIEWDPNKASDQFEQRVLELHYQTPEDHLINLAYRYDLGDSEATRYQDTDLSFRWPVNPSLELVGRWYYSLLYDQTMEAFAGVEYGKCCWRLRVIGRHFKNKPDSAASTTVMVQLELSGLGTFGHRIDNFLEQGIYGYHAE